MRLIEGGPGTGKTTLLIDLARRVDPSKRLLIAPDPITKRELSGLAPDLNPITLEELALRLIRSEGDLRLVTPREELELMSRLLSSQAFRLRSSFEAVRTKPSFAREVLELISLLKMNGLGVEDLLKRADNPSCREKVEDLSAISSAYEELLGFEGLISRADLPWRAIRAIPKGGIGLEAVFLDKLERLTLGEYELLKALKCELTATVDPGMDGGAIGGKFKEELEPELMRLELRRRVPSHISEMAEGIASGTGVRLSEEVELIWERTVFEETEAVALRVKGLVEGGMEPGRIAIICRNLEEMWRPISMILSGYGLPIGEEGVWVMSAEEAAGEFDAVFIMELAADRFPRRYPSRQILSGEEMRSIREFLRPFGIPGAVDQKGWYAGERMLFSSSVCRCCGRLHLSFSEDYVSSTDCKPSPFLVELVGDEELSAEACRSAGFNLVRYGVSSFEGLRSTLIGSPSLKVIAAEARPKELPEPLPESPVNLEGRRFSHSSIRSYLVCPRRFLFEELFGLEPEKPARVIFGRTIHETLRRLHDRFREMGPKDELLAQARIEERGENLEEIGYAKLAKAILERYVEEERGIWKEGRRTELLEAEFEIEVGGFKLVGKIDRIDRLPDGRYEIIDYKASSSHGSLKRRFLNEKGDPSYKPEDYQLPIYYLGASRGLGLPIARLTIYNLMELLRGGKMRQSLTIDDELTEEELELVEAELIDLLREICRGVYPPEPRDERECDRCPFDFICDRGAV